MMYANFATVYDRLMQDIPYQQWVDYIFELFKDYGDLPSRILDLGCGTGNVSIPLAERGMEVVALDLSSEMLAVADEKAFSKGLKISFLRQDMRQLEVPGKFDAVLSMCDSLNYLTNGEDLSEVFRRVAHVLNPGGLFIFDLNTMYKLEQVFGQNTFTLLDDDVAYVWENEYSPETKICTMDVTFFVENKDGLYQRFEEQHMEKGYSTQAIKTMLTQAGLELLDSYEELTRNYPGLETERIYYLARRR